MPVRGSKVFIEMGSELLDLHTLFEAGGNDPQSRERVLDVITRLVDTGHLEPRGSDFYSLTDKGRSAVPARGGGQVWDRHPPHGTRFLPRMGFHNVPNLATAFMIGPRLQRTKAVIWMRKSHSCQSV